MLSTIASLRINKPSMELGELLNFRFVAVHCRRYSGLAGSCLVGSLAVCLASWPVCWSASWCLVVVCLSVGWFFKSNQCACFSLQWLWFRQRCKYLSRKTCDVLSLVRVKSMGTWKTITRRYTWSHRVCIASRFFVSRRENGAFPSLSSLLVPRHTPLSSPWILNKIRLIAVRSPAW